MTRRTRPEAERLEAISFSVNRVSGSMRDLLLIVAGGMSLATGAIVYALADDLQTAVGGAGVGACIGIVYVTALAWDLARAAITKPQPASDDGDRFAQTGPRTLTRLPDGVTELAMWRYLIDVARETVTLSQAGAREHGLTQVQSNEVKQWLIDRGWVYLTNPALGHWDWTDDGRRVRDALRREPPMTWNEIIQEIEQ